MYQGGGGTISWKSQDETSLAKSTERQRIIKEKQ